MTYQELTKLTEDTMKKVQTNKTLWKAFLHTAGKQFGYEFREQVLIYAQRPNTTALLSYADWKKWGRYVKKGAKGIAVFDPQATSKLRYYFDFQDTAPLKNTKPKSYIWTYKPTYEQSIVTALQHTFDQQEESLSKLLEQICEARTAVLMDLNMDEKQFVKESVLLMVHSRLETSFEPTQHMLNFSIESEKQFYDLGYAISEIGKDLLSPIAKAVRLEETKQQNFNHKIQEEEHHEYRINLSSSRGRIDSQRNSLGNGRNQDEPIRQGTPGIYADEVSQRDIRLPINEESSQRLSQGSTTSGSASLGAENAGGNDTAGLNERVGRESSLADTAERRTGSHGNLDLGETARQDIEQISGAGRTDTINDDHLEESENNLFSDSSISKDDITAILCRGGIVHHGKYRIYHYFLQNKPQKETIQFLKEEYGIGGSYPAIVDRNLDEWHDARGITISKGSISSPTTSVHLKWNEAAKRIGELIKADRYLTDSEKAYYPTYEKQQRLRAERSKIGTEFNAIIREYNQYWTEQKQFEKCLNQYVLTDCGSQFTNGNRKTPFLSMGGDEILPLMQTAVQTIVSENTPLTARALQMEELLNGDLAKPFRPLSERLSDFCGEHNILEDTENLLKRLTEKKSVNALIAQLNELCENNENSADTKKMKGFIDELEQIHFEPKYEYQYEVGSRVFMGSEEYEIVSMEDNIIKLLNVAMPLFTKSMEQSELDELLKADTKNGHLQVQVEEETTSQNWVEEPVDSDFITYQELCCDYPDSIVLFEVGAFYEAWGDCAKTATKLTKTTLTEKTFTGLAERQAMCGFPKNKLETYVDELTKTHSVVLFGADKNGECKPIYVCSHAQALGIPEPTQEQITDTLEPIIEETVDTNFRVELQSTTTPTRSSAPIQYAISDTEPEYGGAKEKFARNINAIDTLHKIESEGRFANAEEQEILSQYVGWGGLSEAFDEKKTAWANEFVLLQNTLSPMEYTQARESTLTAFYTPPIVIQSIYNALENMGLTNGNILEPSCGTGNFIGLLPDSMKDCQVHGVEIDSISGRIAKQLYQKSSIMVQGFEKFESADNFFHAVVGNVPFGQFGVHDSRYDKHHLLIHDYFFIKSLDKLCAGGVMALITSKGTLDKKDNKARKMLATHADLIGAIRLPDNTFRKSSGTEVTSDILFLQKRDTPCVELPDWINLGILENGVEVNNYFVNHPDMILGDMVMESSAFGMQSACKAKDDVSLTEQLAQAVSKLHATISVDLQTNIVTEQADRLPASTDVKSFSYTMVGDDIYYQTSSYMEKKDLKGSIKKNVVDMIAVRTALEDLIEYQRNNQADTLLPQKQATLKTAYENFVRRNDRLSLPKNKRVLQDDSSYPLLSSLERFDENGNFIGVSDIFTQRTIGAAVEIMHTDSAFDAMHLSMTQRGFVDLEYMQSLTDLSKESLLQQLSGVLFEVPGRITETGEPVYQTADEYLSGNIRKKLRQARIAEQQDNRFAVNVEKLKEVLPRDLTATDIKVHLGATWVPVSVYQQFLKECFEQPFWIREKTEIKYSKVLGEYKIENKSYDKRESTRAFGTGRMNPYSIIEESLNLKKVRIFDRVENDDGKMVSVLNEKETTIAQAKQKVLERKFSEWVWEDESRRSLLCSLYNERFNSERPRTYDGSYLTLPFTNPNITLRPHQKDAIAAILYGSNVLLDHCVGAGKTWAMAGGVMESKRLGLCNKALIAVPNHIVSQFAKEFRELYPSANLLAVTENDFTKAKRQLFCSKIATGNYDAIIIAHSQLLKIPVTPEREAQFIREQIDVLVEGIASAERNGSQEFSVKRLEQKKKLLENKLEKGLDVSRDGVIYFEQLGVDKLIVDEVHEFKNLYYATKMSNVSGLSQSDAKKSQDLFLKCRYLDEVTGQKGMVFSTGTPISNSITEMYTMQRYLDYEYLKEIGLDFFDAWASTFGQTTSQMELSPEGGKFRLKTRFAQFNNLPELQTMYRRFAHVVLAEDVNLNVPDVTRKIVECEPSKFQKEMVKGLGERAERIRNGSVNSAADNMLCVTNDGRKLALDQRLLNPNLPDDEHSKVSVCVNQVFDIWEKTKEDKLTQMVFCDLSTPNEQFQGDKESQVEDKFEEDEFSSVYQDIRQKLIDKGIPEQEVQFVHSAKNAKQKQELFAKVNQGEVRVLLCWKKG